MAASAVTNYAYDQLPVRPQTSRLLHVRPASSESEELWASLICLDITQDPPPEYEALSYVWGDQEFPEVLHLDEGGTIAVTAHLFQCLVSLRRTDRTRVLWVDAVCINQESLHEKERQVAFMGKIYKNASRAVIWLGESSPTGSPTFAQDYLECQFDNNPNNLSITYRSGRRTVLWSEIKDEAVQIYIVEPPPDAQLYTFRNEDGAEVTMKMGKRSISPLPPNAVPLDGLKIAQRRASELLAHADDDLPLQQAYLREAAMFKLVGSFFGNDEFELILRYGIEEIYTNPWFTRMWVVQEVCLAPKAVLVHRGCEMDWLDFSIAMNLLSASAKDEQRLIPAPASFARACELVSSANLFKAAATSTKSAEQQLLFISRLSHTLRSQKCKLDHDRIYALLSLWPEESSLSSIVPDYSKPVTEIFRQFSAKLLTLGIVENLCDAGIWERHDLELRPYMELTPSSLPTWAPDFRQESRNSRLPWLKHFFRQSLASKTIGDPGWAPITVVQTNRGFSLDIEILVIDLIKGVLAAPSFPSAKIFDPKKENSYGAVINHVKACKQLFEEHMDHSGYPIAHQLEGEAYTPFWATVVSFSQYTATPSAMRGAIMGAKALQSWSRLFEKYCLDDGGAFSINGDIREIDVDAGRAQMLEKMEFESEQKNFDAYQALMFYDIIRGTLNGVRFIVTSSGFVGLAPATRLFNCDVIVMIRGNRIPFILRPVDGEDSYVIVGSCYVFGFMDWIIKGNYKLAHLF